MFVVLATARGSTFLLQAGIAMVGSAESNEFEGPSPSTFSIPCRMPGYAKRVLRALTDTA